MERSGNKLDILIADRTHAADISRIYAPYVTDSVISFEVDPPSAEEMAHKIEKTLQAFPWLVAVSDGEIAGYAYAGPHRDRAAYRWSTDVGIYLAPLFHRRGIGSALYRRLFEILREQNYYNAYAGITLPNEASVSLHEALGFWPVGRYENVGFKFGEWHDTGWWQLSLRNRDPEPAEPIPFAKLV